MSNVKSLFFTVSFFLFIGCAEQNRLDKSKESELPEHSFENSVHLRHMDLIRMNYLLELENEHLDYFLNQKDYHNPSLYKEWWNYYETDKTILLLKELKIAQEESEVLLKSGLIKLDSMRFSKKISKTVINSISTRIETLKLLTDSLNVRIEKEFPY